MESMRIGELKVGYRQVGSGPTLVILPGAMDDGRVVGSARCATSRLSSPRCVGWPSVPRVDRLVPRRLRRLHRRARCRRPERGLICADAQERVTGIEPA